MSAQGPHTSVVRDGTERPLTVCGLWLDSSGTNTFAGCDVCGREDHGPYDDVRQKWLTHTHDPLYDIRSRLSDGFEHPSYVWRVDVAYLLDWAANHEPTPPADAPLGPDSPPT